MSERLTIGLAIAILAMLAFTVVPAQQQDTEVRRPSTAALSDMDHIEIQQLVRKSAWALDSGDNYGYAYADLFTPDGTFVVTDQPNGRTYEGRDQLATVARGMERLRITPTPHHDDRLIDALAEALVDVWERLDLTFNEGALAAA